LNICILRNYRVRTTLNHQGLVFKKRKVKISYNFRNIDIAKQLLNIAKKKIKLGSKVKIIFVKDRPGHDFRYALNSNKIFKKLKWRSKTSLKNGLKNTFDWYLNNKNYYTSLKKRDIRKRLGSIR